MALIFLVSMLCISTVNAADDDAASDILADTSDVTVLEEGIDDAVLADSQDEENVLSDDEGASEPMAEPVLQKNFTSLREDITNGGDTVYLEADYLFDNDTDDSSIRLMGISINGPVTVYGNGHTIDGNGISRIFNAHDSSVVFHDIIFKNGFEDFSTAEGTAIRGPGIAINCTFINNTVVGNQAKGAAMADGTAINCTFINNNATFGGAICRTTAVNCTFLGNKAEYWGGAAHQSTAIDCVFIGNNAGSSGGATYEGSSRNCIYVSNSASSGKDQYSTTITDCIFNESATLSVADFTTVTNSGEKQMINLTVNDGVALKNVPITIKLTKDGEDAGTYSGLSSDGWAVNLSAGNYNAEFSVDKANVEPVTCAISVGSETSFMYLNYLINNKYLENSTIYLDNDYEYIADSDLGLGLNNGISIYRNLTIDGNGHKIDGSQLARLFWVKPDAVVTFKNMVLTNGYVPYQGYGGAIWAEDSTVKAIKCNFTNNRAHNGGAIANGDAEDCYFYMNRAYQNFMSDGGAIFKGNAVNCIFVANEATNDGGAISEGNAINSSFTANKASNGGAIFSGNAIDCTFEGNEAHSSGGAINDGDATGCTFKSNEAGYSGGAINGGHAIACTFISNNAVEDGGAICFGDAKDSTFTQNTAEFGGAISNGGMPDAAAVNCTFNNNTARKSGGAMAFIDAINCSFTGNNVIGGKGTAMFGYDDYICHAVNCIFTSNNADKEVLVNVTADSCIFNGGDAPGEGVVVYQPDLSVNNFTSAYNDGSVLAINLTSRSGVPIDDANIQVDVYTSAGAFVGTYNTTSSGWKVPLNAGSYVAKFNATDFDNVTAEGNITVNKDKSAITSKAVTTIYNKNKYLVITLKDSKGNALSGQTVTVTLASAKKYKTDKNGQIKINIAKLVPKTYNAKISFAGNANYLASSKTVKATVKKAAVKMTAKKKTFKRKVKVKKYTIVLKNNIKKAIKGAKVTLKVNKKTFKAKTNKKGKAVFKIKNLKKKGTYKAVIKFAGNKYYKKVTKKVKIRVKR